MFHVLETCVPFALCCIRLTFKRKTEHMLLPKTEYTCSLLSVHTLY